MHGISLEAQSEMSWEKWQEYCYIKDVKLGRIKVNDGDFHLKKLPERMI